ncbi:MAG: DUF1588 domain-containing protein [Rubripirellula sp.]
MPRNLLKFAADLWVHAAVLAIGLGLGLAADARGEQASKDPLIAKGQQIYRASCTRCHGEQGKGVEEFYADPLVGDLTIGELKQVIADTMPEEDPDTCVAEDAGAVAAYVHHAFYSEAAQVRNRPPRTTLSRLTGEQLRQSLADLYGRFEDDPWIQEKRGVKAVYFDGARWKKEKIRIERVDPIIDFDFGNEGPAPGEKDDKKKINPEDFYIQWSGSLKVERTGRYEIVLRSSCSCVMDFGANDRVLINNHVQSEGKDEFRRTLHLTAGRCYPFVIEFTQRKRKTEQPAAKVSLSWVPPGDSEEIIPPQNLIPDMMPPTFALQTKLPADDRSYGYERGTAINQSWDASTSAAAIEFGQFAANELYAQYRRRHRKDSDENRAKLRGFLTELVETACRGPLDDDVKKLYIDRQLAEAADDAQAIKRAALMAIKSPRFLYPALDRDRSKSQRAANRLALVLFDSLPSDRWLRKLIEKNQLEKSEQIGDAAWRMTNDYRSRAKTRAFLYEWLDLSHLDELSKDSESFPGFDKPLVGDLKKSLDAFLDEVVWSEASDFRQLLQADWMISSDRIANYYGDSWKPADPKDAGKSLFRSVGNPQHHVGVMSHPLVMSNFAYHKTTSPIHRGVFLTRHVMGRVIRPPNAAFSPLNPDLHPALTTRERVELQTNEVNCQVCHSKINAMGFALEGFDATGRFRTTENEKPIDTRGGYLSTAGEKHDFDGARELGDFLAGSPDCHRAFVDAAFEHFVKQPIAAYGPETSQRLTKQFQDSGYNVRKLIVWIAMTAAQHSLHPTPGT